MSDTPPIEMLGLPIGHTVVQPYYPDFIPSYEIKLYKESWYNIWMVQPDKNKVPKPVLIRKEYWKHHPDDTIEKEVIYEKTT